VLPPVFIKCVKFFVVQADLNGRSGDHFLISCNLPCMDAIVNAAAF
jgi:hypothetical protein